MDQRNRISFNKEPAEVLRDRKARQELNVQQQAEQARMSAIKQSRQPLGGAPSVKIPPLSAEPLSGGGTMQQQASVLSDPSSPLSPSYNPQLAQMQAGMQQYTPEQQSAFLQQQAQQNRQPGIPVDHPMGVLPPGTEEQPGFRPGMGSMYTANQPHLKQQQQPQQPLNQQPAAGYKPNMSDKTKASMAALADFQAAAQGNQIKEAAKPSPRASTPEPPAQEDDMMDELRELNSFMGTEEWNVLNNPERKALIEARLDPMDVTDIIVHGEIRQDVIVIPGTLWVTFRSVMGAEDLAIKRMMFGEEGGDRYMLDKFSMMQLTAALVAVNGEELPTHLSDEKKFDEVKFLSKFDRVMRFPFQFLGDLGIQYFWFDTRVRELFTGQTQALKNS